MNVSALDDIASGPFGAGPKAQARMGTYTVIEIRDDAACQCIRLAPEEPQGGRRGRRQRE